MENSELMKLKSLIGTQLESDLDLDKIERLILNGNAILFVGAGFSLESINVDGYKLPLAKDLAKIISKENSRYFQSIGADENYIKQVENCDDLMISSDIFLKEVPQKNNLLNILKRTFSVKEVTDEQVSICKNSWRKIYTTNYDNAIELASLKSGKTITSLDLTDDTGKYRRHKDICLHINGKIDGANERDLDNKIKLTTSSYLSSDQFLNSPWYSQFKNDIEHCSAIFFVGYSMYDLDVQKILFNNKEIKSKTFFITRENSSKFDNYKLSIFGNILNIGINGFSKILNELSNDGKKEVEIVSSMEMYQNQLDNYEIRDFYISKFMLFGNVSNHYIDQCTLTNDYDRRFIYRKEIEEIKNNILSGDNVIITSDLGNGKTILVKILMSIMTRVGFNCYLYSSNEYSFTKDIEILSNNKNKNIIFIDNYDNSIDELKYILEQSHENIQVVITARHYGYENTKELLLPIGLNKFKNYNLDYLLDDEVDSFINIVDNLGAWGDKAGLSKKRKLHGLDDEAKKQLSILLLSVLESESIKTKINEITNNIFKNKGYKETIFAILLIDIIGHNMDRSIISDMAMNNVIFSTDFIENKGVINLFRIEKGLIKTRSSTLSRFLISNQFEPMYIANQLLEIVNNLNKNSSDTKDSSWQKIIKSLLRFSIVEKVLPQKRSAIKFYYEKLKVIIPRLIKEPHYWVQYAMSVIPFKDYPNASIYLETAYSLAELKGSEYHTNNINTQQARLFFLKGLECKGAESFDLFTKGDSLMQIIPNDIFKYRQISLYITFYEKVYATFNKGQKVEYERALKKIIKDSESRDLENGIYKSGDKWIEETIEKMNNILNIIENNRKK